MRETLFAYNRLLREKEQLRQDDQLARKLKAVQSTINNGVPRCLSVGKQGRKKQMVIEKQEEISKVNLILLRKLKNINDRPNKSTLV